MKLKLNKNEIFARFASCVRGTGLLKNSSEVAGHTLADGVLSISAVSFGFDNDFKSSVVNTNILTRRGIFRGKISRRKTQTNKNCLEERTPPAPNL
ncbi:MAG TPA: hypothetical protein VGF90_07445 [Verrucomicrobiae bacterium]